MTKRFMFIIGGNWHLYHKIAEVIKSHGYAIDAIAYNKTVYHHLKSVGIYDKVYDLLDLSKKNDLLGDYECFNKLSLNQIIHTDRVFSKQKYILGEPTENHLLRVAKTFDFLIDNSDVSAIVFEPGRSYALIAEAIALAKFKKCYYPTWPKTSLGFEVATSSAGIFHQVEEDFLNDNICSNVTTGDVSTFINDFRAGKIKPVFKNVHFENVKTKLLLRKIESLKYLIFDITAGDSIHKLKSFYSKKMTSILNLWRSKRNRNYFKANVSEEDKYFFYGMHYDPDLASLVWSRTMNNQVEVIRLISKSLPDGYKLYVKEHPAQNFCRDRNFYKQLSSFHNVVLLSPKWHTDSLIKSSITSIVLSSTIGFESIMYGKKPIVLGDDFYKNEDLVFYVDDFRQLHGLFKSAIDNVDITTEKLKRFVSAYISNIVLCDNIYKGTFAYKYIDKKEVEPIALFMIEDVEYKIETK